MHFKPKKRLGQNFLVDKNIQQKIIRSCALSSTDMVLEIGAGKGALTYALSKCAKKVFALEIEESLCAFLKEQFACAPNVQVINQDILDFDIKKSLRLRNKKIKVIGNIPYYISSPILEHLFRFSDCIDSAYLTVQKEFAARVAARPGSKIYGALSCFVQYHSIPKVVFTIKKGSFSPVPKVDSSLVKFDFQKELPLEDEDERKLFLVIRKAFSQRRKTLKNSLKDIIPEEGLRRFSGLRPEQLSLNDFVYLSQNSLQQKK